MVCKEKFSYDIDMKASAFAKCEDVYIPDFDLEVKAEGRIVGCRLIPIKQDGCSKSCKYRLKVDYQVDPYVNICGPKKGHANFEVFVDADSKIGCGRPVERPCRPSRPDHHDHHHDHHGRPSRPSRPDYYQCKEKKCRKEKRCGCTVRDTKRACRRHARLDCSRCSKH